jgi:TldD protein
VKVQRYVPFVALLAASVVWAMPAFAVKESIPDNDVLMRALVDELGRSMELRMEDLEQPYFIQYNVDDVIGYEIYAKYGALVNSDRDRDRRFRSLVRVGSFELDNTNFRESGGFFAFFGGGGGGGARASLPIDDDYLAIRQAIWRATDRDYKDAIETLTRKRAYLKDKTIEDRPNDFSKAAPVEHMDPSVVMEFDRALWEKNLETISGHFKEHKQVQDSGIRLVAQADNEYVVNSEGTRVRTSDSGVLLLVNAEVQAQDGMMLSGSRTYTGESTADLPPIQEILSDIDKLVAELTAAMEASTFEQYTGPILFDGKSAAQLFQVMLAPGVVGKPDIVGEQRRSFEGAESLEKKLGTRILPRSFRVWDDPTVKEHDGQMLFGHYKYDDEGVPGQRVDIVVDGKLENMCMSRVPTDKLSGTNGHCRQAAGGGGAEAAIGTLFIEDEDGMLEEELKAELIELAKDEGLEYGVRIKSIKSPGITSSRSDLMSFFMRMQTPGGSTLGDPVIAYKVQVKDGKEEPFRGCEFGPVEVRSLKRIAAAGDTPEVYNYIGLGFGGATPASTIIAPPVLFEELELSKIEQEYDKLPILKAPLAR